VSIINDPIPDRPTVQTFAGKDHDDLAAAASLVNGVIDRHRKDMVLPALSAFTQALLDIRLGEHYLGGVR
jgi:hypothetical protein